MIAHTSGFKTAITKLGRDINVLIDYYAVVYNLITEDNKLIITQDNMELLTEDLPTQEPTSQLTNDDIISLNKNNLGELFRTYMKSFDLETTHKFNVGDKMIIKVGTSVNGEIEYLNYGLYYVYEREYQEDTQTYTYTLCDRMLFTMQKYDNATCFGNNTQLTCKQLIINILTELCGFDNNSIDIDDALLVNKNKYVYKDTFDTMDMTCRDVLDMLIQLQGCSLVIGFDDGADFITAKTISTSSVDTINNDILKDKNISIGEKYGKLNSLLFSRANEVDNIERKDDTSIYNNGKTQYVIDSNYILDQDNREDYIDALFNVMNGLEYYVCDVDIIGLGYIEYLDRFTINANNNLYPTICLKDTSNISNGMSENFTTEAMIETKKKYENIGLSDKEASITMNKLKGQIVLKTDSDGKIAQVRLDSSGDEGSQVVISGDNISLEGKDIKLTTDDITISSTKFNVDKNGNMTCNDASMNNATMNNINITSGKIQLYTGGLLNGIKVNSSTNSQRGFFIGGTIMTSTSENGDTPFALFSETGSLHCGNLDGKDGYFSGDLTVLGSKNRAVETDNGKILMNAYETATPYFGDIGTNKTNKDGICKIEIDKTFIQTIEEDDYKVFIQKLGEGDLYVEKHKDYFNVKGTPNLEFDYEIKAIQKGYKDVRMEKFEIEEPKIEDAIIEEPKIDNTIIKEEE